MHASGNVHCSAVTSAEWRYITCHSSSFFFVLTSYHSSSFFFVSNLLLSPNRLVLQDKTNYAESIAFIRIYPIWWDCYKGVLSNHRWDGGLGWISINNRLLVECIVRCIIWSQQGENESKMLIAYPQKSEIRWCMWWSLFGWTFAFAHREWSMTKCITLHCRFSCRRAVLPKSFSLKEMSGCATKSKPN